MSKIDWEALARPSVRGLDRYSPGPSRAELRDQLGLDELVPLHWNEDLFGPPAWVLDAAAAELEHASLYPESAFARFRDALSEWVGVPTDSIVPAHGAQSLINVVASVFLDPGTAVVVPDLTYGLYAQVSAAAGARVTDCATSRSRASTWGRSRPRPTRCRRGSCGSVIPTIPTGLRLDATSGVTSSTGYPTAVW